MTTEFPSSQRKARVVLVDDHPVLRGGMKAMINEESDLIVVGEADGVRSALDAIESDRPDVAVIDLAIRDGDGLELIKEVRNRHPEVRMLVLSMYDETVYADRALRAGALGYIMKAEAARSVIDGIRCVLRGDSYVSNQLRSKCRPAPTPGNTPPGTGELSDRELQVLRCIGNGLNARQIAEELFISPKTVEAHRENIKHKLGLTNSGELLRYAIENNQIQR